MIDSRGADLATEVDAHHGRQLAYQGYTVLLANPDGTLTGGRLGLFDFDTRILSQYSIRLGGTTPRVDAGGSIDSDRWVAHLTVDRCGGNAAGPVLPQDVLEIELRRRVGNGLAETIVVRNHSMAPAETVLEIELDADFRDLGQLEGAREDQPSIVHSWDAQALALLFEYHAEHQEHRLERALRVQIASPSSRVECHDRCLRFPLSLPPRGTWRTGVRFESLVDGQWRTPLDIDEQSRRDRVREKWRASRSRVVTSEPAVALTVDRAADDLFSLRLWEQDCDEQTWIPSAGLPTYTGLFGRDVLTAGWQAALLGPDMLRGALVRLALTQSREDSAWRDAEPGKM
ncbi:MAG: glycogen debranching N-terminal domain-containing protein, partial [Deltaproteobacteria bacterium]